MSFILAMLSNRLFLWIVGGGSLVAAVFMAMQLGVAHGTIKGLNRDIVTTNKAWTECKVDLGGQKADNLALKGAIDARNKDIETWRQKAQDAQTRANEAVRKARNDAAEYRAQARRIAALKPSSADHCAAAVKLHVETLSAERP